MRLDRSALLARLDFERRTFPETGFAREESLVRPGSALVRHVPRDGEEGGVGTHGFISWSALEPADFESVVSAEVDRYGSRGWSLEWKLFNHDQATPEHLAALAATFVRYGFVAGDEEAAMVAEAEPVAAALAGHVSPEGIVFRRLSDTADFAALDLIHEAVWGAAGPGHWLPSRDLAAEFRTNPDQLAVFLAETGEGGREIARPVSAAWARFNQGSDFVGLWGGSTHPDFRRRGIYRHLLGLRAREALERGRDLLYVDASFASRPILERLGFTPLTASRPFVWSPRQGFETKLHG